MAADVPTGIRGRYPVEFVLQLLASGTGAEEILGDCPDLVHADILAAPEYGALATRGQVIPFDAA